MNKTIRFLFLLFVYVFTNHQVYSQNNVDLQVLPFSEASLVDFLIDQEIKNAPNIMGFQISSGGRDIILTVTAEWDEKINNNIVTVGSFTSNPFNKSFVTNRDLAEIGGKGDYQNDVVKRIASKGKPSGKFIINASISLATGGGPVAGDSEEIIFLNPQPPFVMQPLEGSDQDINLVWTEWNKVDGARAYRVIANVRINSNQSLEEALRSGNLYVDTYIDKNTNLINLAYHKKREWKAGDEVVVQVIATALGTGGIREYESTPLSFYISADDNSGGISADEQKVNVLRAISNLDADPEDKKALAETLNGLPVEVGAAFINGINSGNISIGGITGQDGKPLSRSQIKQLINYMSTNPDKILSIVPLD